MEQARMATTQTTASASAARGKSALSGRPDGQHGAGGTDFLALLGFLADEGLEAVPLMEGQGVQEEASGPKPKKSATTDLDLGPGMEQMPWLLSATAVLRPGAWAEPARGGPPPEGGRVSGADTGNVNSALSTPTSMLVPSLTVDGETRPSAAQPVGVTSAPAAPAGATPSPVPVLGSDAGPLQLAGISQGLPLGGGESLVQGAPLEATGEVSSAPPLLADPSSYQSTLDRAQEVGSGVWRGKGSGVGTVRGAAAGVSRAEWSMSISTTVASRVAERTVDLAQWAPRDVRGADAVRTEPGMESESLLSTLDREPVVVSAMTAGASANQTGGQSEGFAQGQGNTASEPLGFSGVVEPDVFQGEALGLSTEDRVADQVSQWVGQTVHNAELTVDRDGQAVQVTVTMSGQEAHVTFRSDEGQTRALLDAHLSELGEMLRNQGLVLSGAWVGTSQQQSRRDDSGTLQSTTALGRRGSTGSSDAAAVAPAQLSASRSTAGLRALDLFV